jgi:hypothetical protein
MVTVEAGPIPSLPPKKLVRMVSCHAPPAETGGINENTVPHPLVVG